MKEMNAAVFRLNPQMLVDDLEPIIPGIRFYPGENKQTLEGVRFYSDKIQLRQEYIYLIEKNQISSEKFPSEGAFVVLGELPKDLETGRASVIVISDESNAEIAGSPEGFSSLKEILDSKIVFNICLDIFHRHRNWAAKLQDIILHRGTIDELCVVSYEYFGNPMFVHDPQLYILSCPIWKEGMVNWEKDELTGTISAPADLLNEFKLDQEYQDTLKTSKAQIFSADLRGHRDLYVNLWNDYGGYLGRLVIVELERPIREGQKLAAEYLAQLIRDVLLGYGNMQESYERAFDLLLGNLLKGVPYSEEEIQGRLQLRGWHVKDRYICLTLYSGAYDNGHFLNISTCNYIEATLPGSQAFLMDDRVVVLVNKNKNPDPHPAMVEILRDHLYMAGISNEFSDLMKVHAYYQQSIVALDTCMRRKDIRWYMYFSEAALEYLLDQSQKEISAEYLCDSVLHILDQYDRSNGTELLKTLKVYILSERNTVLASKNLYIGRSTLFYRLRTIAELTGLDGEQMAEPERNLYLRISFALWEQAKREG